MQDNTELVIEQDWQVKEQTSYVLHVEFDAAFASKY